MQQYPNIIRGKKVLTAMKLPAASETAILVSAGNKYDFEDVKKAFKFHYPLKASGKPNATSTKGGYFSKGAGKGKSLSTWTKVMVAETTAGAPPKVEEGEADHESGHEKEACDVEDGAAGDDVYEDVNEEVEECDGQIEVLTATAKKLREQARARGYNTPARKNHIFPNKRAGESLDDVKKWTVCGHCGKT